MKAFGFGLGFPKRKSPGSSYDEDAQNLFDFVGDVPTIAKNPINDLIIGLKDKGYWDNAGFWMVISVPTLTWENTLVEIKSLTVNSAFQAPQTAPYYTETGTYPSSQKGYTFAGANYIETDFNPSVKLTVNDSTEVFATYQDETTSQDHFNYGAFNGLTLATLFITNNAGGKADHSSYAYNATRTQGANASGGKGVYMNTRRSATDAEISLNGTVIATNSNSGGTPPNFNVLLNTYNSFGAPSANKRNQSPIVLFGGLGEAVSIADRVTTSALFEDYQTTREMIDGLLSEQIVINGNSHTVFYSHTVSRKLEYDLIMKGYEFTNFGVNSKTTTQMISNYSGNVGAKYNSNFSKNILVPIEITNDYYFGATKEQAFQNYKDYCANAKNDGYIVISAPIFCRNYVGNTGARTETQFNLDQDWLNTKLENEYISFSDYLVPTHPNAWIKRSDYASDSAYNTAVDLLINDTSIFVDKTHLTEDQYKILGGQITTVINTINIPTPVETTIVDVDFSTALNLDDFTISTSGTTAMVLDSGYVKMTGTPSPLSPVSDSLLHDYVTGLENFKVSIDMIIKTHSINTEGVAIGFVNDSTVATRDDVYYMFRDNGNGADGITFKQYNGTAASFISAITQTIDDEYRMTLEYSKDTVTLTVQNLTNPEEASASIKYDQSTISGDLGMSSSKLGMFHVAGENWIKNFKITTTDTIAPDYLVIGSKETDGYCAEYTFYNWFEKVQRQNDTLSFTKSARYNDKPSTAVNKDSEFILVNPTKAILFIGAEEVIADGAPSAQSSYTTMYANLVAQGITDFIHLNALPQGGNANINTFNTYINSTYGADTIVDLNALFNDGADSLLVAYDCGDGVNINSDGHELITTTINLIL